jgi:hypothetical protein
MGPTSLPRLLIGLVIVCSLAEALVPSRFRSAARTTVRFADAGQVSRGMFQLDADCGDQGVAKVGGVVVTIPFHAAIIF